MTIQRTLLISYILISLVSALLIALMIFAHFRNVLKQEIAHKLESQAITIMQQIDTTLFERLRNIDSWSHLGVMQEIRTRDVDKRLSVFLHELHKEYGGVYQELFVVNLEGQIIASSNAERIGENKRENPIWYDIALEYHRVSIETLTDDHLTMSIRVNDPFENNPMGRLCARLNWREMSNLLNESLAADSLSGEFYALLIDDKNRAIAFSSNLQDRLNRFQPISALADRQQLSGAVTAVLNFLDRKLLIGYANAKGYRSFSSLNWQVLIIQPRDLAFAPVSRVAYVVLVVLAITLFLSILASFWISAKLANPIKTLEKFTRDFRAGHAARLPEIRGSSEINALHDQFGTMIDNLEKSRRDVARVAKLAVMGEMAASMAHEVRTPLGILRSSAQILQREPELSEIGREMTDYIISETRRLNDLVNTLLECAIPREPNFTRQSIDSIIHHVIELIRSHLEQKQIDLQFDSPAEPLMLECDRDHLIQVFLNLIINAVQHVEQGGVICIKAIPGLKNLEIQVCDNGPGIADEYKHSVFDPFFTQRADGIGLGLTVVQQIVLAHHGDIVISDNQPKGCCFRLLFPYPKEKRT